MIFWSVDVNVVLIKCLHGVAYRGGEGWGGVGEGKVVIYM